MVLFVALNGSDARNLLLVFRELDWAAACCGGNPNTDANILLLHTDQPQPSQLLLSTAVEGHLPTGPQVGVSKHGPSRKRPKRESSAVTGTFSLGADGRHVEDQDHRQQSRADQRIRVHRLTRQGPTRARVGAYRVSYVCLGICGVPAFPGCSLVRIVRDRSDGRQQTCPINNETPYEALASRGPGVWVGVVPGVHPYDLVRSSAANAIDGTPAPTASAPTASVGGVSRSRTRRSTKPATTSAIDQI